MKTEKQILDKISKMEKAIYTESNQLDSIEDLENQISGLKWVLEI